MMANIDYEADIEQIRRIRSAVEEAENSLDSEALGKLLTDDVAMMPVNGPELKGLNNVVDYHRELYDSQDAIDIAFLIKDITVLGGIAVEKGTYKATLAPADNGEPTDISGQYLYTYEKDSAGVWKIHRMSW
ncbi:MAG: nuclear transport factor 2 family protein [Anaerolineales bacterium]